ncbi:ABC transporter ATP-binding protein [Methylovirgula sp. 4M-Z18]|uniref:ABC transporter ATP-binding protein n=1 Tax=Methylovirgula sp. 4M-Z18 TaxID=2293567 RepID=UPI000E2F415C|nr:ABC transporter ATP-binding protein [Methylovirgula sp. 4M-Z18]RFB80339.1 ABC transporter ATP-binding protein [Methylovirgula sp. 4M-Z18]
MSIGVEDVSWASGKTLIVDGVTLHAPPGKMLGLLGPNGSGKSSLLRLICRLRQVKSGIITLGDTDIRAITRHDLARRLAFVEQQSATDADVTVLEVIRLGRTPHRGRLAPWTMRDDTSVQEALKYTGLADKAHQLWHTLSGGERQRVQIARALAQTPTELLLDEPTNHLDIRHQLDLLQLIAGLPVTSIVALHDLNLAAMFCDNLAVLQHGKVVAAGTPEAVLTPELIADVFGVKVHVERSNLHGRSHVQYLLD